MMTLVALVTDHFNVADCPRSTVLGSTVNATTVGRPKAPEFGLVSPPVGAGTEACGGSGMGFLHPTPSAAIKTMAPMRTDNRDA